MTLVARASNGKKLNSCRKHYKGWPSSYPLDRTLPTVGMPTLITKLAQKAFFGDKINSEKKFPPVRSSIRVFFVITKLAQKAYFGDKINLEKMLPPVRIELGTSCVLV